MDKRRGLDLELAAIAVGFAEALADLDFDAAEAWLALASGVVMTDA